MSPKRALRCWFPSFAVVTSVFVLTLTGHARAQFPNLDPDDCTSVAIDPLCAPTAVCSAHGNAPAIFDPATVTVVPICGGGTVLGPVADADGTARYACLYEPAQASTSNPLPLVVFLHPSLTPADAVQLTGLIETMGAADLTGDPARPGFILLTPEGRNTCHYYPTADQHGDGWDNWYRNLDPNDPAQNVDAATIDHFIAEQVGGGKVDAQRIFVTGWSNGAAMAYLYGLNRPSVAAVAVYSSPDPFRAFNDPCPQVPVADSASGIGEITVRNPNVPTFHLHNDCDIAGICPMGERLEASLRDISHQADHLLINTALLPAAACNTFCGDDPNGDFNPCTHIGGYTIGVANHLRWPVVYDSALFDFFRAHPLAAGPEPGPLTVTAARVKVQVPGKSNGSIDAQGDLPVPPPLVPGDVTVRVDDGLALDRSHTWTAGECVVRNSGAVSCTSGDRSAKAKLKPVNRPQPMHRYKVSFRQLPIDGPVAPPLTVTLTYGSPAVTHVGSLATCSASTSGMKCRRR